eukprot:CAMPEP_0198419178 /NCGR_PEP_ID=MMETSP1452-20131203/32_1 /TAXON_ID=1181717 /ORGANISM="Synchroma pusillum, Strain CCMP3072" /LENGTH=105 /DNA_ID=CAMNT_0044139301 /DNA_START=72 /DNA_END=389 /DNA_ORIENTATION=-
MAHYGGGGGGGHRVKRVMLQPIVLIFQMWKEKKRVSIWLYENTSMRIEGRLLGFDEFLNVVLDEAQEIPIRDGQDDGERVNVGRIMLKGDAISVIEPQGELSAGT